MELPVFKNIVVAFDGSAGSNEACELATFLARSFKAVVYIVTVLPPVTILSGRLRNEYIEGLESNARMQALKAQSELEKEKGVEAKSEVLRAKDSITRSLIDFSEEEGADLIVAGTRGLGTFRRMMLGSVSTDLLNQATCPVLVSRKKRTRKTQETEFKKILVATDGSESANRAVGLAVSIAKNTAAQLTIVHVVYMPPSSYGTYVPVMDQIFSGLRNEGQRILLQANDVAKTNGVRAEAKLIEKDQSPVIALTNISEDERFDLIVLGTRGQGRVRKAFLGSVANGVVHYAKCSVLVTR